MFVYTWLTYMQTPTYLLIGQVHRFLIFLVHTDPFVGLPLPDYRPGFVQEHELLKVITCQARSLLSHGVPRR